MYDSVMVDLETMGHGSRAAIVSIGMFKFSLRDVQEFEHIRPEQTFYRIVSLKSCTDAGLEIDASTVEWWGKQSEEARAVLHAPSIDLLPALTEASDFMRGNFLWGNGATFDNVIIRNAFKAVGLSFPIHYTRDACFRTINTLFGSGKIPRYGVAHNALDDAISQGLELQKIMQRISNAARS